MTTQREPQVGDKIKLTGDGWNINGYSAEPVLQGQVVTIKRINRYGEACFSFLNTDGDSDETFLLSYAHRRRDPLDGECWHFADEPREGDLVKLTGSLWTRSEKEAGPYRVILGPEGGYGAGEVGIYLRAQPTTNFHIINYGNPATAKTRWGAEALSENPGAAALDSFDPDESAFKIGGWVKLKPGTGIEEHHPGTYQITALLSGLVGVRVAPGDIRYWGPRTMNPVDAPEVSVSELNTEATEDQVVEHEGYDVIDPPHYKGFSNGAEPIDIIEHLTPNKGTAVKYLARAGRKPDAEELKDLRKALRYVQREINLIEGNPSW